MLPASDSKKVSNPFSTGGGGYQFEQNVQAYFLAIFLMKGVFPIMERADCCKIELQARRHHIQTDDLVVYFSDSNQQTVKLLAQVKHKLTFTQSDEQTKDALEQAWTDFCSTNFNPEKDKIVFITGTLPQVLVDHLKPIFEWARCSENEEDFIDRFQHNATEKKKRLENIRSILDKLTSTKVSDQRLWKFLKVLNLLSFDFDYSLGKDTASVLNQLLPNLINSSEEHAKRIWDRIYRETARFNVNSGVITRETLPQDLLLLFRRNSPMADSEWRIPHFDAQNFVGNKLYLQTISERFEGKKGQGVIVPLYGLGGVGKTYLALKTIADLSSNYLCIAWFNARSQESLREQFLEFAIEHDILFQPSASINQKIEKIKGWFVNNPNSLLIFDDAESYTTLKLFLPRKVHVLVTSLNSKDWSNGISIDLMNKDDAVCLLKREAGIELSDQSQNEQIDTLIETLDRLPLAIAQAGVYICASSISVADYCQLYESTRQPMLKDRTLCEKRDEHESVYVTFELCIQEVQASLSSACDLLHYCSYFNPNNIPREILKKVPSIQGADNLLATNEEVATLKKYSLVKASRKFISVHCVIQDVVRERLASDGSQATWLCNVLKLLKDNSPYIRNDKEALRTVKLLVPHMIRAKELALDALKEKSPGKTLVTSFKPVLGVILYKIGVFYLDYLYDSKESKSYLQKAEPYLKDPKLIRNNNRYLLKACTKYNEKCSEAERYATKLNASLSSPHTVKDVDDLCALGNYYLKSSNYDKAKNFFHFALKVLRKGKDDEKKAMVLHYLGTLYTSLWEKKRNAIQKAIKKEWGEDWIGKRENEAQTYNKKALDNYEESLRIKVEIYNSGHIEIGRTKHQLGNLYLKSKNFPKATNYLKDALDTMKSFYDTEPRIDIANILHSLSEAYKEQGKLEEAKDYLNRSLQVFGELPGDHSKEIASIKSKIKNISSDKKPEKLPANWPDETAPSDPNAESSMLESKAKHAKISSE
ncbi:putative TPR repeat-containing protein [Trichoplax sp. H2]|nr:putative TPR repeat-containing protein [Trichoplax sp. H2]|eukprot:RDD37677.1 putative TPR repeat-containing protein [Trichoplax sp. H2]